MKREWKYIRDPDNTGFVPHARVWGAKVHIGTSGNLDYTEPDMKLIAAAPDLLEALQVAVDHLNGPAGEITSGYHKDIEDMMVNAIRKATE